MKTINILFAYIVLAAVQTVSAQKPVTEDSLLNRTVVVENQYNPEVTDAFKINVLPAVEEPKVVKQEINYAVSSHTLREYEQEPMNAMPRPLRQEKASRGYVRAAYGNMNNTDLKGSYLWDISGKDRLNVMVSMYGRNGTLSCLEEPDEWKSRFYRTDASLDFRHDFSNMALSFGGAFASQVFNYMPSSENASDNITDTDRQHYTMGEGYVKIASNNSWLPVNFSIQTGFRTFKRKYGNYYLNAGAENIVHTSGHLEGTFNRIHHIGIGMQMDNVIHDSSLGQKDLTLLKANPYYMFRNGKISLRTGVHADLQTANGSGMKWAPDISLNCTFSSSYTLFLDMTGGTELNDFRRLNDISPYWMQSGQLHTSYTPLDVRFGLKASPSTGFSFKVDGGYRITEDEVFVIPETYGKGSLVYASLMQGKASMAYGSISVDYICLDRIDFNLSGQYYEWNMTDDDTDEMLMLKPHFTVNFSERTKVAENLHVVLDYQYEKRKYIEGFGTADPVNNLCVGAEYMLFDRMKVFARLNNILDKNYLQESGYPIQGLYFMAGLSCRF